MVNIGPVCSTTCPNGAACPHDMEQHRFDDERQRWTCTVSDCAENPERVITVWPTSLTFESYERHVGRLRAQYGPDVRFEIGEYPSIGIDDQRGWLSRWLGRMFGRTQP